MMTQKEKIIYINEQVRKYTQNKYFAEYITVLNKDNNNLVSAKITDEVRFYDNYDSKNGINNFEMHKYLLENLNETCYIAQPYLFWCNVWASIGESVPPLNTFHVKNFFGEIPCTRDLFVDEIENNYAKNITKQLIDLYNKSYPYKLNAALIFKEGAIVWSNDVNDLIKKIILLEETAKIAYKVRCVCGESVRYINYELMDKLYKNGEDYV